MKNNFLQLGWCILLFGVFGNLQAQNKDHRKDHHKEHHKKVKAYRISFLTEELDLSTAEAEKFWPLFRRYDKAKDSLHKAYYQNHRWLKDSLTYLTDASAMELIEQHYQKEHQLMKKKEEMAQAFAEVIGAKKTLKFLHLEHRFRQRLVDKMRKKKEEE